MGVAVQSPRWTWESGSSLRACDIPWPPTPRSPTSLEEDHCGCGAEGALVKFCTRPWSNLQKTDCIQLGPDTTKRFPCKKPSLLLHPPNAPGPVAFRVHTEKQAPQSLAKFPISTTKKSHLCLIQTPRSSLLACSFPWRPLLSALPLWELRFLKKPPRFSTLCPRLNSQMASRTPL